jgi:tetratricopeptide (TPR) repeat protein
MEIDLTRAWARAAFLTVVTVCSGVLSFFGGKACVAALLNSSPNSQAWLKAANLEPGNAEYWAHVGLSQQWELSSDNARDAALFLQKATQLNPHSADLWMALADEYESLADSGSAEKAYEKAQADYPVSSDVAWRYGNFLLYEQKLPRAYEEIRRAISVDPTLTEKAVAECWQSNPDVAPILDQVLPPRSEYYLRTIEFFLIQKIPDAALAVWNRQRERGLSVKLDGALPLVDVLIQQNRIREAQETWNEMLQAVKWSPEEENDGTLVWNGGFEHKFANGGFDWRLIPVSGAKFEIDRFIAHSGSRSLRIRFDGMGNLDFAHVFHYVAVAPDTHYRFSAYLKTEEISTDHGIYFEVFDPWHPAEVHLATPDATGTTPWTAVQADIVAGRETRLLEIAVRRTPSWKFDNKLSGTVWIDDVNLTPVQQLSKDKSG